MAFIGYGFAKGLAYRHNWESEYDRAYKNYLLKSQKDKEDEAKAALWTEKLKSPLFTNQFDKNEYQKIYQPALVEIGKIVNSSPNYNKDIQAQVKVTSLLESLQNSDPVIRDATVKQNRDAMYKDFASGQITAKEYDEFMTQYNNYVQTGNMYGDGNGIKEFTYRKPRRIEMTKLLSDVASKKKTKTEFKATKLGLQTNRVIDPNESEATSIMFYNDHKEDFDSYWKTKLTPEERANYNNDIIKWIDDASNAFVERESSIQQWQRPSVTNINMPGASKKPGAFFGDYFLQVQNGKTSGQLQNTSPFVKGKMTDATNGVVQYQGSAYYYDANGKKVYQNSNGKGGFGTVRIDAKTLMKQVQMGNAGIYQQILQGQVSPDQALNYLSGAWELDANGRPMTKVPALDANGKSIEMWVPMVVNAGSIAEYNQKLGTGAVADQMDLMEQTEAAINYNAPVYVKNTSGYKDVETFVNLKEQGYSKFDNNGEYVIIQNDDGSYTKMYFQGTKVK